MNANEPASDPLPSTPAATLLGNIESASVGATIGPYKLMEQIGEGGFGLVFVAEQQVPVRRKVALKVIKPGMDTRDVIARFEAERQALAMMDHPNIARVLDAGATDSGRPYFVMELVRGVPITDYCDRNRLTPRERLELFIVVCQAVQHAHQKGIIHRDIKPSNVMVTLHDGLPLVKVIDFGVAKALHQSLTEKTIYTRFAQMVGTPLYMSPEQAEMSGLDIDTRTDIYSLGVLMYELLTGTTPFDRKRVAKAAYDDLIRMIREEEPPKPSTRLSQSTESLPTIAEHRRTEPGRLSKMFRGDLDWITMKALEKDRTRRYETASGLAADVQRYLHDEPVEASPPSAAYRLKKLARRHRGPILTAAAFALFVIADAIAGTWMAFREKSEREAADRNAALAAENAERAQAEAENAQAERRVADQQRKLAEAEKARADTNAARADQGRRQAETARRVADAEKRRADVSAAEAERRRAEAESQRQRAEELSDRSERRVYALQIADAQREWEANHPDNAWAHLNKCRRELRGWELDYLVALFTRNQRTLKGHSGAVKSVAFRADGKRIVSGSLDGSVKVWDRATGRAILTLEGARGQVTCAAFSPDGTRIVSGTMFHTLQTWDASDGRLLWSVPAHKRWLTALAFSPDGTRLVTASGDNTLQVWDATTGKSLRTLTGHTAEPMCVSFSPDGTRIVSGGADRTLAVWDATSGKRMLALNGHTASVSAALFMPDGKKIVSGGYDQEVKFWDAASGRELPTPTARLPSSINCVALTADGKRLVAGCADASIRIWDIGSGREPRMLQGHTGEVDSVALSPDGKQIVSGSDDRSVKIWNEDVSHDSPPSMGNLPFGTVAFSPDGQRLALGGWDNQVRVWDVSTLRSQLTFDAHDGVRKVVWSPDGKRILTGLRESAPKVWDAMSGQEILSLPTESPRYYEVVYTPDGKRIIGGFTSTLRFWDATTGKELLTVKIGAPPQSMAISVDGKCLATQQIFGAVALRDASDGHLLRNLNPPTGWGFGVSKTAGLTSALAFSPDGKHLVSYANDKTLRVWDASNGRQTLILEGHDGDALCAAYSPDGRRIVTGSSDWTVKLWDAATGQETMTLRGHRGSVNSVAWSPDGECIASASFDGTVRIWDRSSSRH
jgi:WD40 repeat protein/serine/threonine protein kinase